MKKGTQTIKILKLLYNRNEPVSSTEIAKTLNIYSGSVSKNLQMSMLGGFVKSELRDNDPQIKRDKLGRFISGGKPRVNYYYIPENKRGRVQYTLIKLGEMDEN